MSNRRVRMSWLDFSCGIRPKESRRTLSCRAMWRSRSLERTERLEIRQYDRTSVESNSAFLRRGETWAILKASRKWSKDRDLLKSWTRYGEITSIAALCSLAGSGRGLSEHDLSGKAFTAATTSSSLTVWKQLNDAWADDYSKDGIGDPAVVQTPVTF